MSKWICKEEKPILDLKILQVFERLCEAAPSAKHAPGKLPSHRFTVFKTRNWANIIPVTEEGKVLLVRQFRVGTLEETLEVPGGVVDSYESDDATIKAHVLRELQEETGYEALPGARCELLGTSRPNPAIQNNRMYSWVVGPVRRTSGQDLDPAEDIDIVEVAIDELPELILRGEMDHALILTTIFYFMMREPKARSALTERLRTYSRTDAT